MNLNLPIINIKGVGEKKSMLLNKLGIYTINDLIHYFPRNYERFGGITNIADLQENTTSYIKGFIKTSPVNKRIRKLMITSTMLQDDTGSIQVTWFNQAYLAKQLNKGDEIILKGKLAIKSGRRQFSSPIIIKEDALVGEGQLMPIYPLTKRITNKEISKHIRLILDHLSDGLEDFYEQEILSNYDLLNYREAVLNIHYPINNELLDKAKARLVFDEFLFFQLGLRMIKSDTFIRPNHFDIKESKMSMNLLEQLPWSLTDAQQKVLKEINNDLTGKHIMNRLVQGDVGSGKTIIAALSLLTVCESGYQGVMMVPTEVLAKQHHHSLSALLGPYGINIDLLTGSVPKKKKNEIYNQLAKGEIDIIIGTHAIIQEGVSFKSLALVVTDEQHRFGVKQREALADKGNAPHVLVMSATPIPRTLALIVYGDMSISIIDELPKGRKPIKTHLVDTTYRQRIYQFIEKEVGEGRQCYAICPMVEDQEELDLESVESYSKKLQQDLDKKIRILGLHGKMKPKEKNEIMFRFAQGEIDVLVSTTVVEVGVNVPNATIMLIENAERFGLAQLHQLRGRVGRGAFESHCILISDAKTQTTKERLLKLKETNDGFKIADYDLKLRGPGDSFGTKQHGLPAFRLGDIYRDMDILKTTYDLAKKIIDHDPDLSKKEHQSIKRRISHFYQDCSDMLIL